MRLELSPKQFRRLLDMVYIGNWILNSTRSEDRITDYDEVASLVFGLWEKEGLTALVEHMGESVIPSRAFAEGGIHEAIMDYEDTVFFEILAEELARRDMQEASVDQDDVEELNERITAYIAEFERNGTDNISLNL
ncbi:MAG: hypothetical protein LBC26_05935 [Oscillospiraceae bacterium]|nr:hypothetical protein [Oscillospiraceae bacterium]